MKTKPSRNKQSGQGMVEYALIIFLVAIVATVAAYGIGIAAQRIFGVTLGAVGGKTDSAVAYNILAAQCWQQPDKIGLIVQGYTAETNSDNFTISLPGLPINYDVNGIQQVDLSTPGQFSYRPTLFDPAGDNVCPNSIVIQDGHGNISVAQLSVCTLPSDDSTDPCHLP